MTTTGKWARRGVWGTLAAVLAIGCNPITLPFVLLRPENKMPAEYPLRPKDGDKDKDITVLVLCSTATGITFEFAGADRELATMIAKKMPDVAKECKEKITVVSSSQLDKFKTANRNWKHMHATAIGKRLGADVVIDVNVGNVNVYQPGSGNLIYEGRAEVSVDVYDLATDAREPKHRYVHPYTYPKTGMMAAGDKPLARFKMEFLDTLATELVNKHLEHRPSDGIAAR